MHNLLTNKSFRITESWINMQSTDTFLSIKTHQRRCNRQSKAKTQTKMCALRCAVKRSGLLYRSMQIYEVNATLSST